MKKIIAFTIVFLICSSVNAATRVKGVVPEGYTLTITQENSKQIYKVSEGRFNKRVNKAKLRFYLTDNSTNKLVGPVVLGVKSGNKKVKTFKAAQKKSLCSEEGISVFAYVGARVKKSTNRKGKEVKIINLGKIQVLDDGSIVPGKRSVIKHINRKAQADVFDNCAVLAVDNYGYSGTLLTTPISRVALDPDKATIDKDFDGVENLLDIDIDNDGVLNPYDDDDDFEGPQFLVFSNLKLLIDTALNVNANPGLDTAAIDAAMQGATTLAVEVEATGTETSELDCYSLPYCSSGGTGTVLDNGSAFPDANDADSDGFGEITKGPTGDFQLMTGASSSQIGAGDFIAQYITNEDGIAVGIPATLDFVFNTTPAVKSVTIGATTTNINYTANPVQGAPGNCIQAPMAGNVTLEITAWRPQRPGIKSVGEADFVDLGNSTFLIDIPNAPCAASGSNICTGVGPGNCAVSTYTTSDTNLSVGTRGLDDSKGDLDADVTNTFTFTVNLSSCISGIAETWDAGEKLFVDLQSLSENGDNAAQKFCIQRAT